MDRVPDELVEVVRSAAAAVPAHTGHLDEVFLRQGVRRRRHAVAVVGLAVAVVGLAVAVVPDLVAGGGRPTAAQVASTQSTTVPSQVAPAQRLLLSAAGWTAKPDNGPEVGVVGGAGVTEVSADGSAVNHPVSDMDGWYQAVGLPDGRLVILGYKDLAPGAVRADGPDVADLSIRLQVLRPDGSVQSVREVRIPGERVSLVAATERTAYLLRPLGLVSHDLATGAEKVVLDPAAVGVDLSQMDASQMDLAAGRFAVLLTDQPRGCSLRLMDLAGARRHNDVSLAALGCVAAGRVRLSPDGRLAAVSYTRVQDGQVNHTESRVAILDTATGAVRADRLLRSSSPGAAGVVQQGNDGVYGMAWSTLINLQVATADLPQDAARVYQMAEILRVIEIRT
jgi:hypothetical protein